ncbi:histidine--tRNA ligase [bacterium]|nr:histidine--tRNA ligase [bacterium]|tara:strand:- start:4389 stop:5636 length:1248 start_codon:yes stop_codon:yes gene_type:complete
MSKISTDSYKGVRDFYPRDKFVHDYIVNTLSQTCESFGYEAYDASILEPAELYRTKTNDEIVNDQTYTFEDRGGREVTLRPEMTPTVARMVAARSRELGFPLRWYSMPNCFRYERAQRGRLREFWQLNADIFGVAGIDADVEIIALAHRLMTAFGAKESHFEIRINDRRVFEQIFDEVGIDTGTRKSIMSLLDRRAKIDTFDSELGELAGDKAKKLTQLLDSAATNPLLEDLRSRLATRGITNVVIDTSIVRGFDYYTGMVFEVFDTAKENARSISGGGRYDHLLEMFGVDSIPTVGFATGDVTMRDFLEAHNLLPEYVSPTDLMICVLDKDTTSFANEVAQKLRDQDINVAVNYSYKKAGDQIKLADKKNIPFVACVGAQEIESGKLAVKHLASREEKELSVDEIADHIFTHEL